MAAKSYSAISGSESGGVDEDTNRRVRQMVNFILQEAREKADEILLKADEEFQIEKGKILNPQRVKLKQEYDQRLKDLAIARQIAYSTRVNKARLTVLEKRKEFTDKLEATAFQRLHDLKKDSSAYENTMRDLIVQSLIRIDESGSVKGNVVQVHCVKDDATVVTKVLPSAVAQYKKTWKEQTKESNDNLKVVLAENKQWLSDELYVGGVIVKAYHSRIVIDNTLVARMRVAIQALLPILRGKLFGITPHEGVRYEEEG